MNHPFAEKKQRAGVNVILTQAIIVEAFALASSLKTFSANSANESRQFSGLLPDGSQISSTTPPAVDRTLDRWMDGRGGELKQQHTHIHTEKKYSFSQLRLKYEAKEERKKQYGANRVGGAYCGQCPRPNSQSSLLIG